jgi:hypothetical protein
LQRNNTATSTFGIEDTYSDYGSPGVSDILLPSSPDLILIDPPSPFKDKPNNGNGPVGESNGRQEPLAHIHDSCGKNDCASTSEIFPPRKDDAHPKPRDIPTTEHISSGNAPHSDGPGTPDNSNKPLPSSSPHLEQEHSLHHTDEHVQQEGSTRNISPIPRDSTDGTNIPHIPRTNNFKRKRGNALPTELSY